MYNDHFLAKIADHETTAYKSRSSYSSFNIKGAKIIAKLFQAQIETKLLITGINAAGKLTTDDWNLLIRNNILVCFIKGRGCDDIMWRRHHKKES